MAHPLYWPGKYYFYPIGNTSAVCLTRDLPPEEPADILLLGCGDPRNVLYTIFCEPPNMHRQLDFTCCDIDPGVLARNVLLLTMAADNQYSSSDMWNIFFHIYLDQKSHSVLVEHCKKLVDASDSLKHWNSSSYGPFIKMCTEYTLTELRRHWSLYIHMQDLPTQRLNEIRNAFTTIFQASLKKAGTIISSARSSGPLFVKAIEVTTEQNRQYWKTGVTFTDARSKTCATLVNPTFVYSLAGDVCSVHYGTDPLTSFHLASYFGNTKRPATVSGAVNAAMAEFKDWCSGFHTFVSSGDRIHSPIIRFFLGEATAVCRALHSFSTTDTLVLGVPVAQWNTQLIRLNPDEYRPGRAPAIFNVIDTSNLNDHIGLLNVLTISVPLLSTSTPSSVLYAESLLFGGQDATKEFAQHLHTNITIIGLLLGVCPVDYLSGFTTRSNTHELIIHQITKGEATQYHQVTTWKSPISGDSFRHSDLGMKDLLPPVFDPRQLGTLLYDIYHDLFEHEDAKNFQRLNHDNLLKAISRSNLIHYIRESFVMFIKLAKHKLALSEQDWLDVMDRFFDLVEEDKSMPMDTVNHQELCAQLHRHGVYTVQVYQYERLSKLGRFSAWDVVPPLVRIILVVPREKLAVFDGCVDTPPVHCDVRGSWSHNIFTSIHTAFGRVIATGTKSRPKAVFEEDLLRGGGSSPLVVSFTMPTRLLTSIEPMEKLKVCFSIRSTTGTVKFIQKLGITLNVFSTSVMDDSAVHILPEYPIPLGRHSSRTPAPVPTVAPANCSQIGKLNAVRIELDEQCELADSFIGRVSIEDQKVQTVFQSGVTPKVVQVSPTVIQVMLEKYLQHIFFPFPVIGSQHRLRLARKSLYIELVVPIFGPFKPDGVKLNPFPLVHAGGCLNAWNVHRLNLSRLPVLNMQGIKIAQWLNPHVGSILSTRERSLMKKHETDTLLFVKETIHSIFVRSTGIQGGAAQRVFALRDKATKDCDTLFFVSDLKYDLHSHTMVCDAYVLPLTHPLLSRIERSFSALVLQGNIYNIAIYEGEMQAWKMLLPPLVERSRTWKHGDKCEYKSQGKIPLSVVMENDPLCSCGRGKDTEGMMKVGLWSKLAPFVTRFALSPLFAVSYLETVGRDPSRYMCFVCRGKGKPKLLKCTTCQKTRYCSKACQKKDWKSHKLRCKPQ